MDEVAGRITQMPAEQEPPRRWWQNPRWIGAVAALIFAFGIVVWAGVTVKTQQTLEARAKVGDQILELIKKLDQNQAGIDSTLQIVKDATSPESQAKGQAQLQIIVSQLDCNTRKSLQDFADQLFQKGALSAPVHLACGS